MSSSFLQSGESKELFYGRGYVNGSVVNELVSVDKNSKVNMKMLAVFKAWDLEGTKADGILGLSPLENVAGTSFVKQMYDQGVIKSKSFGVYLGDTTEKSYIEFGVLEQPNTNLTPIWVKVISTTYWAVQVDQV